MLEWIGAFVGRWSGRVASDVRDVVKWTVHALAGVVYTVFGHVGGAWHEIFSGYDWIRAHVAGFAHDVYNWIQHIVTVDIPYLWHILLSDVKGLIALIGKVLDQAIAAVAAALKAALRAVDDAIKWVIDHVYGPLKAYADQIWHDLLKWGYTAWFYVTHPDKLAPILLNALIAAAEAAFWDVAGPAGRFILGVLLKNAPKLAALLETIIAAVL